MYYFIDMEKEIQISAIISRTTKQLLERHARSTGIKKGHLIEEALRHHLLALQELPADAVIHPKLVVSPESGKAVLDQIEGGKSAKALRDLMRRGN
jgi:hypothetical protein